MSFNNVLNSAGKIDKQYLGADTGSQTLAQVLANGKTTDNLGIYSPDLLSYVLIDNNGVTADIGPSKIYDIIGLNSLQTNSMLYIDSETGVTKAPLFGSTLETYALTYGVGNPNVNTSYIVTNKVVSLTISGFSLTVAGTPAPLISDNLLPIEARPARNTEFLVRIKNNGTDETEIITINASGSVVFSRFNAGTYTDTTSVVMSQPYTFTYTTI